MYYLLLLEEQYMQLFGGYKIYKSTTLQAGYGGTTAEYVLAT